MNLYVYETSDHAVVVDYGVMFADPQHCGIDSILPDVSYLKQIKHKLRAAIITHGHEDHTGALWDMVEQFALPVYTGRFTAELLRHKLGCARLDLHEITPSRAYGFGDIEARFFHVRHSIPDTFGVLMDCAGTRILHLSDFTGEKTASFLPETALGGKVDILLLDSTNAINPGCNSLTEGDVAAELVNIMNETEGRVFFTTFASNVLRIGSAIAAARQTGRRVVLEGAAIEKTVGIATRMGLLSIPEDVWIPVRVASCMNPGELLYIISGCQGEYGSALHGVSTGERKSIRMESGDTLIFSSRAIPGNERNINAVINRAARAGAGIIQASDRQVHISGHAKQEELTVVLEAVQPQYFIPIHGEYRHMAANRNLAIASGVVPENAIIAESGDQLSFHEGGFTKSHVAADHRYFDARGSFILDENAYILRKSLARDGVVIVHTEGENLSIDTVGFALDTGTKKNLAFAIANDDKGELGEKHADRVRRVIRKYFKKNMSRRPIVMIY